MNTATALSRPAPQNWLTAVESALSGARRDAAGQF